MNTQNNQPYNQDFFNNIAAKFDTHVKQSIPLFELFQQHLVRNLAQNFRGTRILDIAGSTGELGRQLMSSDWSGRYTCLDGSPHMQEVFNAVTSEAEKETLKFELAAFGEGWEEEYKGKNITIPAYNPNRKQFDVAIEVLGFQFFTKDRAPQVKEMHRISNTCIFFEKFSTKNKEVWEANEGLKNKYHKSKYFTAEQIQNKQDEVLDDMGDYLCDQNEFEGILNNEFPYVVKTAQIGNFAGYICTDLPSLWVDGKLLLNNRFTSNI